MNTAVSAADSPASPTRVTRRKSSRQPVPDFAQERAQSLEAIRAQHENWFVPTPVFYTKDGAEQPRKEAWYVRTLDGRSLVLSRKLVIRDVATEVSLGALDEFSLPDTKIKSLLEGTDTKKRADLSKVLKRFDEEARSLLKKLFDRLDALEQQRENGRAQQIMNTVHMDDAQFAQLEADNADPSASPASNQTGVTAPREQHLGYAPRSQLNAKNTLRGTLISWGPYRGQDAPEAFDGVEQWFAAVWTEQGPRHVFGEDLQGALKLSGAIGGDTIRIIEKEMMEGLVIEERHGSHGEGEHRNPQKRQKVLDIYIEARPNLFGAERYRHGNKPPPQRARPQKGSKPGDETVELPEAVRDLNIGSLRACGITNSIENRTIEGWTKLRVEGRDALHLRLLSFGPDDHLLIVVYGKDCVERYVYPEPFETAHRRALLRLPDLVIQPAEPPAASTPPPSDVARSSASPAG